MRILYLEDDPRDAFLAQRLLATVGPQYQLEIAHTVKDAVQKLGEDSRAFDVVRSHNGDLSLVCTQHRILKVFEITGLTKVFSIHDSVDAAVAD